MSHTARMVALLGEFRRERNGLVADTMYYEGSRYGLNYGVSLPTLRRIVGSECRDHELACFLRRQEVRCLQLSALHLADPERLHATDEAAAWLRFLTNSELAEEAAYALFSRSTALPTHVVEWLQMAEHYGCYALLMALARTTAVRADHLEAAFAVLHRFATPLMAKGVVTLASAAAMQSEELRQQVERLMASHDLPHGDYIRDELAWRIQ
ncbi:MAG: DNA alkylation repair enzyme [Alistipes sp.]|nr:DNA alkylation repair enzyme [Alistipes sp.]